VILERGPGQRSSSGRRTARWAVSDLSNEASLSLWSSTADGAPAGGDWCEEVTISPRVLGFTIGDVAGHGAPVADTMGLMRSAVVSAMRDGRASADVLAQANAVAGARNGGAMVTAIVATYDRVLRTLTFANAGHPPPLLVTRAGERYLQHVRANLPLGIFETHGAREYVETLFGDALVVFYTDGITEHARDPLHGEVELAEAARLVYERPGLDAARTVARLVLAKKRGNDDAAALVLRTEPTRR